MDLLLAPFAFGELLMVAGLVAGNREAERATRALRLGAVGVGEAEGGSHAQTNGTQRHAIRITDRFGVCTAWDCREASMTNSRLRDRPCIRGSISRKMRGERVKSKGSLPIPRTEGRDVSFMEGLGVFGQDNIASVRRRSNSHTGARAPEEFFLLCGGAVSECFARAALDTELAIRIACKNLGLVVAIGNGGTLVVFLDPGGDMLDVERDNLASSGKLVLEGVDGASEQRSEQAAIQTGQFLVEPGTARQAVQDIKAVG